MEGMAKCRESFMNSLCEWAKRYNEEVVPSLFDKLFSAWIYFQNGKYASPVWLEIRIHLFFQRHKEKPLIPFQEPEAVFSDGAGYRNRTCTGVPMAF